MQKDDEQQEIIEHLKLCLQSFCDDINNTPEEHTNSVDTNVCDDNFHLFKRKKTNTMQSNNISCIIENYLYSHKYDDIRYYPPALKRAFIKYNTSVSSSAHVERLFSAGGLLFDDLRGKLTDRHFEMTLLKFNHYF